MIPAEWIYCKGRTRHLESKAGYIKQNTDTNTDTHRPESRLTQCLYCNPQLSWSLLYYTKMVIWKSHERKPTFLVIITLGGYQKVLKFYSQKVQTNPPKNKKTTANTNWSIWVWSLDFMNNADTDTWQFYTELENTINRCTDLQESMAEGWKFKKGTF